MSPVDCSSHSSRSSWALTVSEYLVDAVDSMARRAVPESASADEGGERSQSSRHYAQLLLKALIRASVFLLVVFGVIRAWNIPVSSKWLSLNTLGGRRNWSILIALIVDRVVFAALFALGAFSGRVPESTTRLLLRWVRGVPRDSGDAGADRGGGLADR